MDEEELPSDLRRIDRSAIYRIRLQGALPAIWRDAANDMEVEYSESGGRLFTTLTGLVADQAALAGVLNLAFMLRMPVISIECLSVSDPDREDGQ